MSERGSPSGDWAGAATINHQLSNGNESIDWVDWLWSYGWARHATTKQIKFILFLWIVWLVCSTASRSSSLWAPCLGPAAPAIISHNSTSLAGSLLRRIRRSIAFLFTQLIRKSWSEKRKDNCWWRAALSWLRQEQFKINSICFPFHSKQFHLFFNVLITVN